MKIGTLRDIRNVYRYKDGYCLYMILVRDRYLHVDLRISFEI